MTLGDHLVPPMTSFSGGINYEIDTDSLAIGGSGLEHHPYVMSVYADTIAGATANPAAVAEDVPQNAIFGNLAQFQNQDNNHGMMVVWTTDVRIFAESITEAYTPSGASFVPNLLYQNGVNYVNLDVGIDSEWYTLAQVSIRTTATTLSTGYWSAVYPQYVWIPGNTTYNITYRVKYYRYSSMALSALSWSAGSIKAYGFPADSWADGSA